MIRTKASAYVDAKRIVFRSSFADWIRRFGSAELRPRVPSVAGRKQWLASVIGLMTVAACTAVVTAENNPAASANSSPEKGPQRWASAVEKIEQRLRAQPPSDGCIIFLGSSSIVGWDLKRSFPDLPAVNCGFGGSHMSDAAYYVERLVIPYRPKVVVVYSGDNDLKAGKTPEQIAADFRKLAQSILNRLPQTRIVVIGVKPSIARWNLIDKIRATNKLLAATAAEDAQHRIRFVDFEPLMLDEHGRPRAELFKDDGLHLNADGYALWSKQLSSVLKEPAATKSEADANCRP